MALIVHKYGGTSMGSTDRIRNVAKRVAKWVRAGHQMVVVPSAMSGETNRLLGLAKELSPASSSPEVNRELDMIAATGEQVSVGLLAIALQAEGIPSVSYTGWQVRVLTDSAFTRARIDTIDDARLRADLAAGIIPVAIEYMDREAILITEDFAQAGYPRDAEAMLIIEVEGSDAEAKAICASCAVAEQCLEYALSVR